ncbi:receptor kinase-like protein Xa21 [Miscanthus floridulus]|uniref:receptor kinase-like protein Xa21 n=1 Tax=Miscanthus floridulus TaxID=154761 RepID=UPI00345A5CAF
MAEDRQVKVKLTMLMLLLALCLLSHGVGNVCCSTVPENSTDMLALIDFKAVTTDPLGSLSSWNTSIHYCNWSGVTCNQKNHGRVTALKLYNQGLSGPISPSVGNLTFLHTLDLSTNQFSGQIPHLNNLQKMQILNLSYNSLDGVIPNTLTNCSNLKELHLYHNLLNGAIPREIGLLKNLVYFALNNNNLRGTIPPTLGNITHIKEFYLQVNQLEGTIPDELGHFSNILMLVLGGNNLSAGTAGIYLSSVELVLTDVCYLVKLGCGTADTMPRSHKTARISTGGYYLPQGLSMEPEEEEPQE